MFAGLAVQCDHLWTAQASGAPFLLIPAARRPDQAGRQSVDDRRQDVHDSRRELAILAVEVRAFALVTARSESEDLGRSDVAGKLQDIFANRKRLVQIRDLWGFWSAADYAQYSGVRHLRLRARAEERVGIGRFCPRLFVFVHRLVLTAGLTIFARLGATAMLIR